MFEHESAELLPERTALGGGWWDGFGGGWWGGFGGFDQNLDVWQDVDVDVWNGSFAGDVNVTAFNNASIDQHSGW
ncbi:hypothetical protein [Saccharopolyspora hordei]|uniref:Uncharacterized protein n=1 Tax=Saccharopolyspora hordei TaxID=1838 RepID=A0A853AS22_9PSEU|nr:hypothetical protein [Saccharopolyspora hordei]NYI84467.1 hypothetical protein [Saccharopolyspora hordei]